MRSPLVLNNSAWPPQSYTRYSRQWRSTTSDDFPKYFIWESGSFFRQEPAQFSFYTAPYYWINTVITAIDPDTGAETYGAIWGVGLFWLGFYDTVDNQDFDELVGEDIETNTGTYVINQDAHTRGTYQTLSEDTGSSDPSYILTIGKLTPV
jgi:hypothetical protein